MKRGFDFWDFLIFIGVIIILGWALLKTLGIINSPIWLEMMPYYGAGLAGLGGAYKLGKIMNGVERLLRIEERFNKLEHTHNMCIDGKLNGSPYKGKH
ncbi:MAG: hypothetical protein WC533_04605 [Candidatus Pacearchaeota archaeon]